MMRTNSIRILVLTVFATALAAAPALASGDYQSVNSITGDPTATTASGGDDTSLNAVLGAPESQTGPTASVDGQSSVNALVGAQEAALQPLPDVEVSGADDGFDWSDAMVGALFACCLMLTAAMASRVVTRHRRLAAAPRT